jgi:hypothetical protein
MVPLCEVKGKVNPRTGHEGPEGGVEVEPYSFFNLSARWGGWSTPRPGRITRGKDTRYPLYGRLDGPQGQSGRVLRISPSPGFDPHTVQPVASLSSFVTTWKWWNEKDSLIICWLFGIIHLNVGKNRSKLELSLCRRWCGRTVPVILELCSRCEVSVELHAPDALSPGRGTRYPLDKRLDVSESRFGSF